MTISIVLIGVDVVLASIMGLRQWQSQAQLLLPTRSIGFRIGLVIGYAALTWLFLITLESFLPFSHFESVDYALVVSESVCVILIGWLLLIARRTNNNVRKPIFRGVTVVLAPAGLQEALQGHGLDVLHVLLWILLIVVGSCAGAGLVLYTAREL